MLTNDRRNHNIATSFGRAAKTYNAHALLQQVGAKALSELIATYEMDLPAGEILEIGCGTGLVTQELIYFLSKHSLKITDLSTEMLTHCRSHLDVSGFQHSLSFQILDAEEIERDSQRYAAIVGGFVLQWFRNPAITLAHLIDRLLPGGALFLSFPTCHSFTEWQQICTELNLPYTANSMPDPDRLKQQLPQQAQIREAQMLEFSTTHTTATDFFRGLKAIGAGVNQTQQRLALAQMKTLIQSWDQQAAGKVQVHYQVACWAIQRIY